MQVCCLEPSLFIHVARIGNESAASPQSLEGLDRNDGTSSSYRRSPSGVSDVPVNGHCITIHSISCYEMIAIFATSVLRTDVCYADGSEHSIRGPQYRPSPIPALLRARVDPSGLGEICHGQLRSTQHARNKSPQPQRPMKHFPRARVGQASGL